MKDMFLPFARATDFSGRSSRREYWMFMLLKVICALLLGWGLFFAGAITNASFLSSAGIFQIFGNVVVLLATITWLVIFLIPEIALVVRRWHDIGNSGWTVLVVIVIGALPYIGFVAGIIHFIAMCTPGDKGANDYGPSPLSAGKR